MTLFLLLCDAYIVLYISLDGFDKKIGKNKILQFFKMIDTSRHFIANFFGVAAMSNLMVILIVVICIVVAAFLGLACLILRKYSLSLFIIDHRDFE